MPRGSGVGLCLDLLFRFQCRCEQLVLNWIEAEDLAHTRETSAMNWSRAKFF